MAQAIRLDGRLPGAPHEAVNVGPVPAFQAVEQREARLQDRECRRVVIDRLGQAARLGRDVLQLRGRTRQALHEGCVACIEAREGGRLGGGECRLLARTGSRLGPPFVTAEQPGQRRGPARDGLAVT